MKNKMRKGFTLIEVLTVGVIIFIIVVMFISAVQMYRGKGNEDVTAWLYPKYAQAKAMDRMAAAQEEQNRLLRLQIENSKK